MIRDNQIFFNRMHVVLDGIVVAASYTAAWAIKFLSPMAETTPGVTALSAESYFSALYFLIPGYLILYAAYNLYSSKRSTRVRTEVGGIIKANTVGIVGVMVVFFLMSTRNANFVNFSRSFLILFYILNTVITILYRYLIRKVLYYFRRNGHNLKHILLVGYSRAAEAYLDRILTNPEWGYEVHGILDDAVPVGTKYRGVQVLGPLNMLQEILDDNDLDEIAITLSLQDYDYLEHIVDECESHPQHLWGH